MRIDKTPVWELAWKWLREDPDRPGPPSKREEAVQRAQAEAERQRKAMVKDTLMRARRGPMTGAVVASAAAGRAASAAATPDAPRRRLWTRSEDSPPGRIASFWHRLLGERSGVDGNGKRVVVPPPETDWRWHVHRFFRSNQPAMVYLRSMLILLLLVSTGWFSILQTTGFDLMDYMDPVDPEDPRSTYRLPFFVIESGSMMHKEAPYGRLGTIDPGDIVMIEKIKSGDRIETFYGDGSREVAGAKGDVIMFLPHSGDGSEPPPIIHRAMAYIHREEFRIPNPSPGANQQATVPVFRYTVEEFGIFQARSINIPELGLRNYQPTFGGYITRGDNERSNSWADQALGVTPFPVPEDRIIGRMKAELPVIGLAKIALSGQNPAQLSPDEAWCSFLAGKAACDTWVVFFVVVIVFVGVPFVLTLVLFGKRVYTRYLDRAATRRAQAAELARQEALRSGLDGTPHSGGSATAAQPLRPHDAADLLSGAVVPEAAPRGRGVTPWNELVRPGAVRFKDDGAA